MTSRASARLTISGFRTKSEKLEKLPEPIGVQIHRLKDKIVTGATGRAWVTHLCDTAAQVTSEGVLEAWEDLRLILLDDNQEPIPGHIYGKVTRVTPLNGWPVRGPHQLYLGAAGDLSEVPPRPGAGMRGKCHGGFWHRYLSGPAPLWN